MGIVTEDQTSLYRKSWVDEFLGNAVAKPSPRFILVACDPNGGGDSNMAIVSVTFKAGSMVVVGLDYHAVKGHDEIEVLLMEHIHALQVRYPDVWFIFVGESNLGQEADHMKHMLRSEPNVYCVMEGGLAGVRTTSKRKELYAMELCKFISQSALAHTGEHMVVVNPLKEGPPASLREQAMKELSRQLLGFRKIVLHSQTGRSDARISYTGKSQGSQDDLVVTATIAAYWGVQYMTRRIPSVPYDKFDAPPSHYH
jgi:hypothetical protein